MINGHPKYYAGVGARDTPRDTLEFMGRLAQALEVEGWTLRTGEARGADEAFRGSVARSQVFTVDNWIDNTDTDRRLWGYDPKDWLIAGEIARNHHPAWYRCSGYARRLHTRNVFQVLGPELMENNSTFVVCWTAGGKIQGGTGQAIRIANLYNIPVYNLGNKDDATRLHKWVVSKQAG